MSDTEIIYLVKDKKNKFLIFPNWKISDGSSLVRENYEITISKGSSLELEGIDINKYLKEEKDLDTYVIPYIFKGDYESLLTLENGLKLKGEVSVDNGKFSMDNLDLEKDDLDLLKKTIKDDINKLYEEAISGKSFDEIKEGFEYDDLSDLEKFYDQFSLFIKSSSLMEYDLKEFDIEKISLTDEGLLYVTVKGDYDYKVKAYLSDDELEKDGEDTINLTYDYKDGFKLTDVSSLDMTFSRF